MSVGRSCRTHHIRVKKIVARRGRLVTRRPPNPRSPGLSLTPPAHHAEITFPRIVQSMATARFRTGMSLMIRVCGLEAARRLGIAAVAARAATLDPAASPS